MSEYAKLLEQVGGDPRVLAAAVANPEVAAMLGLTKFFPPSRIRPTNKGYDYRLELAGGDPRILAAAVANPEVAAMLGLQF